MSTPVLCREPAPAGETGRENKRRKPGTVRSAEPTVPGGLAAQAAERRAKRHALRSLGISPYPARFGRSATLGELPAARSGQLLAALADALFTSDLSARCEHTRIEVATAIRRAISTHAGIGGCVAEVAAEYGEHPETAARRMRGLAPSSTTSMQVS